MISYNIKILKESYLRKVQSLHSPLTIMQDKFLQYGSAPDINHRDISRPFTQPYACVDLLYSISS